MFLRVRALLFFLMFYNLFFRGGRNTSASEAGSSPAPAHPLLQHCGLPLCSKLPLQGRLPAAAHVPMAKFYFAIYQT